MYEYETFQAQARELHRVAEHERLVRHALLGRRAARRRAAADGRRTRPDAGGIEGTVRTAA
ncbi:hypothetical protein LO772_11615 [Yinghuangia sp. ASG 101]|uniref:hypothetical protein n=1 Tax=Yinghuangia sp. ASG 101 TaxID=2896848 RepID=UPI001E551C45|nr:hypothetical protein [Yinghuangia sp. ASG 101]UGQ14181.1 hypothetical protein LO772_11615 [Yinghuangia sp. ASG 101]